MEPDQMPPMERAWTCAGLRATESTVRRALVLAPEDDALVPLLVLPAGLTPRERELAFGWAAAELEHQRGSWLFLVRRLSYFARELGRVASVLGAVAGSLLI
jgi:predicted dienelactone hydrolase